MLVQRQKQTASNVIHIYQVPIVNVKGRFCVLKLFPACKMGTLHWRGLPLALYLCTSYRSLRGHMEGSHTPVDLLNKFDNVQQ